MTRLYLKIKVFDCPECKGIGIIGYICHRCGIKLPADLKNKGRITFNSFNI